MGAEPSPAGRPETPLRAIDRRGRAPEIGIMMRDPTARAVHFAGGARAGLGEVTHQRYKRLDTLGQVGGLSRPVIHLGIDVDRIFGSPRRRQAVVPEALEVGCLRAWP